MVQVYHQTWKCRFGVTSSNIRFSSYIECPSWPISPAAWCLMAPGTPCQINKVLSHPTLPITITAQEDRHIKFFDNNSGKLIHSMVAHLDAVTSLAVDPNGLYLMSGSKYHSSAAVRFWICWFIYLFSSFKKLYLIFSRPNRCHVKLNVYSWFFFFPL